MKKLLAAMLVMVSCASFPSLNPAPEFCGKVDVLDVYVRSGILDCESALQVTNEAYELLWQKDAGPLNETWRVEYVWGGIGIDDPWARTYPAERLIQVTSEAPFSIFHELKHACMFETETGGRSHHRKMCKDEAYLKLERDFGVKPYCHLVR